jgi:hypothetical protein
LTAASGLPLQVERTKKREPDMPLSKYFKGKGEQVMSNMQDTYKDPDKAKQVFYATAAKNGQKPDSKPPAKRKSIGQRMVERAGY